MSGLKVARSKVAQRGVMAAALATLGLWSFRASALECEANSDCPQGFTCEVSGVSDCAAMPCAEGETCEPLPCQASEIKSCVSIDCQSDAECADGMLCETITNMVCTESMCPEGETCEAMQPSCQSESQNVCVPRYAVPCSVDADCGEGFTCVEQESCGCAGSAGGGTDPGVPEDDAAPPDAAAGGASADPALPSEPVSDCVCEPSGVFACVLDRVACATDADCVAGFSCQENPEGVCSTSVDGGTTCTPADPAMLCMPPYVDLYGGSSVGEESGTANGPTGTDDEGEPAPEAPKGEAAAEDPAGGESASGGCSIESGHTKDLGWFGLSALALIGGAFVRRRRS